MHRCLIIRFFRRHRPAALAMCMLAIVGLALPSAVSAGAQLVIQSAERERWYGEDNLYGEAYGKHIAMDTGRMVTTGDFKAVVWEYDFDDGWQPVQVLEPGIGRIEDVAHSGRVDRFRRPLVDLSDRFADRRPGGHVSQHRRRRLGAARLLVAAGKYGDGV